MRCYDCICQNSAFDSAVKLYSTIPGIVDDIHHTNNIKCCVVLSAMWKEKVVLGERYWQSYKHFSGILRPKRSPKSHAGDDNVIVVNTIQGPQYRPI